MAAGFAMSRANVEGPDGALYAKAAVLVRQNKLTVKLRGEPSPAVDDATVSEATRLSRTQWQVTTSAGVFTITRDRSSCCGAL